ncbi:MAG: phenylacetic acid degradation operon negative regulatory protein PaaX, partial [Cellvibrionaceae bacterium]|nr:phenylacetic acid degradation operon negative regulatory protein PaaX [Cellvibrionaceae bacterium]
IYAQGHEDWDGKWTLVLPAYVVDEQREQMRKELTWAGFGQLTQGVLARPGAERQSLDETLQELGIRDKVIVMTASTEELTSQHALKDLAANCWSLDQLEARYLSFLDKFRPVLAGLPKDGPLDAQSSFQLRTLLVHEYRRILLKDSDLPEELLPNDWAGKAAQRLTANIYKRVQPYAEQYLLSTMETAEGQLPEAAASYYKRFGGLV